MKRIEDLLRDEATAILDEAAPTIERLEHYHRDGAEQTRLRVEALYRHVARAITARDLDGLATHAARVARERFDGGFDVAEVRTAVAALEEAIERRALARLSPEEQGLVGTALAHARSELWRTFASLASDRARGADRTPRQRFGPRPARTRRADELVYPV